MVKLILHLGKVLRLFRVTKLIVERMVREKRVYIDCQDGKEFLDVVRSLIESGAISIPGIDKAQIIGAINDFDSQVVCKLPTKTV